MSLSLRVFKKINIWKHNNRFFQQIGTPRSSSVARHWQSFHVHTIRFEPVTFLKSQGPKQRLYHYSITFQVGQSFYQHMKKKIVFNLTSTICSWHWIKLVPLTNKINRIFDIVDSMVFISNYGQTFIGFNDILKRS